MHPSLESVVEGGSEVVYYVNGFGGEVEVEVVFGAHLQLLFGEALDVLEVVFAELVAEALAALRAILAESHPQLEFSEPALRVTTYSDVFYESGSCL